MLAQINAHRTEGFEIQFLYIFRRQAGQWAVMNVLRPGSAYNNVFNRRRVYPSGYSYLFITRPSNAIEGISYFYPQAARHAIVTLDFHL